MIEYSKYEYTSDSIVMRAEEIVDSLNKSKGSDNPDHYTKVINGERYIIASRTYLFGKICEKNNGSRGISSSGLTCAPQVKLPGDALICSAAGTQ